MANRNQRESVFALGTEQNDVLTGAMGDDFIEGLGGNDMITGKAGDDFLYGDDGDDRIAGNNGDDEIGGGEGDDHLTGGAGDDWLEGDAGDDLLNGNEGADWLQGGQGHDTLLGGKADDILWGDDGNDRLAGGAGADKFWLWQNISHTPFDLERNIITDFNSEEGDRLVFDTASGNENSLADLRLSIRGGIDREGNENVAWISNIVGNHIYASLEGVDYRDITESTFDLYFEVV